MNDPASDDFVPRSLEGFEAWYKLRYGKLLEEATRHSGGDVSSALSVDDLKNPCSLASKIKTPSNAVSDYLRSLLSASALDQLDAWQSSSEPPNSLQLSLINLLNGIIGPTASIWDQERFLGVKIRTQTKALIESAWTSEMVPRLNRMLLEDAYPLELSRNLPNGCDLLDEVRAEMISGGNYQNASSTLSVDDIMNPRSLASKIKNPTDTVSAYLRSLLSKSTLDQLYAWQSSNEPPNELQFSVIKLLNEIIGPANSIWDQERFDGVKIRTETKALIEFASTAEMVARINRMLLEDAYPLELSRNPPNGCDLLVEVLAELKGIPNFGMVNSWNGSYEDLVIYYLYVSSISFVPHSTKDFELWCYFKYHKLLEATTRRSEGNVQNGRDLLHEVLARLIKKPNYGVGDFWNGHYDKIFFIELRRELIDSWRKLNRSAMGHADSINGGRDDDDIQDLLNTIPAPNTDLGHQASNWKTILHTLMKKLPKDQAQVVQLLYIEEKSVKDVSEMTGFSEPKVKISGFRGRQKLREMIQENTSLCDELRKIAENIE